MDFGTFLFQASLLPSLRRISTTNFSNTGLLTRSFTIIVQGICN
ncbi:hypothetical protein XENTR_v10015900 [Xenopus tropicalis]|nr:hypothetical protein XENTR_v10015900 [Xenopus tropicalis]